MYLYLQLGEGPLELLRDLVPTSLPSCALVRELCIEG